MAGFWDHLFSRVKYDKELKELQQKVTHDPQKLHLRVRIGDLLAKMGNRAKAVETYRQASEQYAASGFLIQAIALNKLILRLDPSQKGIPMTLAELYDQRGVVMGAEPEAARGEVAAKEERLPPIPLFSDLKKEELSRVMEKIQAKQFAKGMIICKEGEPGNSIFIISHGKVGIFRQNLQAEKIWINELKEGDFFGEFGFFSSSRRNASVEALKDTEVLEISKEDFQEIIQEFPSVSAVLFKFYKERVLDTLLATSELFQSFSPLERKEILDKFTVEEFPQGAIVMEEGAPGDSMYIIKKGEVEVFTFDAKGAELTLARLKEGDFCGEISLITGKPRTASVKVLQPTELVCLAKNDFDQIIARHPGIRKILEETLQVRMEEKLKALGVFKKSPEKGEMV